MARADTELVGLVKHQHDSLEAIGFDGDRQHDLPLLGRDPAPFRLVIGLLAPEFIDPKAFDVMCQILHRRPPKRLPFPISCQYKTEPR